MRKTVFALITVLAMLFLAAPASAANTLGTVTVSNAIEGSVYELYRAFEGSYLTEDGVTYASYIIDTTAGTAQEQAKAAALVAAISAGAADTGKNADGSVKQDGSDCPFELVDGMPGIYYVQEKEGFTEAGGRNWLKNHLSSLVKADEQTAETDSLQFTQVEPGYYLVVCTDKGESDSGAVVTVTNASPDAQIIDKNPRTPSDVDKDTTLYSQEIGAPVPFTTSFKAMNFRVNDASESARVLSFVLTDTAEQGFDYLSEDDNTVFGDENGTITIYRTKNEDGSFSDPLPITEDINATVPVKNASGSYEYPQIAWTYSAATHKLTIVWGDEVTDGTGTVTGRTSRYPSNVWVVVNYSMNVNDEVYVSTTDGYKFVDAVNHVLVEMKLESQTELETVGEDRESVKSTGLSLSKTDSADETKQLTGARFILYKTVESGKKYYTWDNTAETVVWVDDPDDADQVLADNDEGTAEFKGLAEGSYMLKEVTAPAGYKLPKQEFTVVIVKDTENAQAEGLKLTVDGEEASYNGNGIKSVAIANTKGVLLPMTGSIGTSMFYAGGALLVVCAFLLLVTRRRMASRY